MTTQEAYSIIYFDGTCNLCNGFVQYVIRHDKPRTFRFASLQSAFAQIRGVGIPVRSDGSLESMLLEEDGQVYAYSTGVLKVLERLDGLHPICRIFWLIPRTLRDRLYRWISRHRYRIFGKSRECLVPTPEIMDRFYS